MFRLAAATSLLLSSLACGAGGAPAGTLLIGNKGEDTVSFVDLGTGVELGRAATGRAPHEIAVSPDGRQAAVVAYGGKTIDLFDVASRRRLKTIDLSPGEGPHGIAWLSDSRIVVTTEKSQSVTLVDPSSGQVTHSIRTGQEGSHMVAVSADGTTAYTSNIAAGSVSVIDLVNARKLRDVDVGGKPEAIALGKDDLVLWVGDLEGSRVQAYDTESFDRLGEVRTGAVPIRLLATPDGRHVITSNYGGGSVTVIDATAFAVVREIPISGTREAEQVTIIMSPDGKYLYAAETGKDAVVEVELASGRVVRRLPAGRNGDGLAIVPKTPR